MSIVSNSPLPIATSKMAVSPTETASVALENRYQCRFETQFAPVYQRNNKAKSKGKDGMKNIRCFPDHGACGHVEKGFCGSTVSFTLRSVESDPAIRAWAQFELSNGSNRTLKVGDVVLLQDILENLERTRFTLSKPWFPTTQTRVDADTLRFVVNSERWGWNYSWVSNVHTCDLTHCLCVYLFHAVDSDRLVCVDIVQSPEFQVFCSRRRRTPVSPGSISTTVASPLSSSASSPLTLAASEEDGRTPRLALGDAQVQVAKRSRSCATGWRDAELAAANLLLMVRTGSQQSSIVN